MRRLVALLLFVLGLVGSSFGQLYAGESFSATANQNVSLHGGKLTLNATTAFSGTCMPGILAPFAPQVVPGTCYSIGPGGLGVTYTVTVVYSLAALPAGVSASSLRLYQVVNDEWTAVSGSTVNTSEFEVTGKLTSTATFAVLTGAPPKYESNIYYSGYTAGNALYRYYAASINNTQVQSELVSPLVGVSATAIPGYVAFSPTRNSIAFAKWNPAGTVDIYAASVDGSNASRIAGSFAGLNGAAWSSNGTTLYLSVEASGSTVWNVVAIVVATGAQTTVHKGGSSCGPSIGNGVLAFADGTTITTISASGTVKTFSSPSTHGVVDQGINVSNDGTKVIWACDDGEIYMASTSGTGITDLKTTGSMPHWSPDGTMVVWVQGGAASGPVLAPATNLASYTPLFPNNSIPVNSLFWR